MPQGGSRQPTANSQQILLSRAMLFAAGCLLITVASNRDKH